MLWLAAVAGAAPLVTSAQEDYGDLLGGFDDEFDPSELEPIEHETPAWLAALPFGETIHERVDLSGSIALGAVYNYISHAVPHGDDAGRLTHWGNLSRLDLDGFLQLDIELPRDWQIRAEALGWYDFVYRIKGRGDYGGQVLDVYEWQVDSGEVYLAGPLHPNVDLTLGRKVVNWGRSDTFRVVDVVNPLDNKEPGLVDIEDLRRPRTMAKLDALSGPWSGSFLVIVEGRYDRLPPPGSDFFPNLSFLPPPVQDTFRNIAIDDSGDFDRVPGLAGKFDGRFSGWDFSLYGAWVDETDRRVDVAYPAPPLPTPKLSLEANRFGMVGAAGNFTRGSWLFKAELAFKTGLRVLRVRNRLAALYADDKDRIDTMVGVEYYGRDSLTIALEVVTRSWLDYARGAGNPIQLEEQTRVETGLRITRPFFRERMEVTLLGVVFGERLQDGGLVRFDADWELTDAWKIAGGWLAFIGGPDRGLGAFDDNDRIFVELKYSF